MENKFVLELIKKDLEELKKLVDSLAESSAPEQLLIDISKAKAKTLLQEFDLLRPVGATIPKAPQPEIKITDISSTPPPIKEDEVIEAPETLPDEMVEESIPAPTVEEINAELKAEAAEAPLIEQSEPEIEQDIKDEVIQSQEQELLAKVEETANIVEESETISEESETVVVAVEPEKEIVEEKTTEDDSAPETIDEPEAATEEKANESPKILGERFTKEPSLNDRLAGSKVESKIKAKPITNLKAAIGLNDRFMYTRELFNNNQEQFMKTIEALDSSDSFNSAIEYLDANFKWPKNETSLKFIELLKRRFQ